MREALHGLLEIDHAVEFAAVANEIIDDIDGGQYEPRLDIRDVRHGRGVKVIAETWKDVWWVQGP